MIMPRIVAWQPLSFLSIKADGTGTTAVPEGELQRVFVLLGGFVAWLEAGLPLERTY